MFLQCLTWYSLSECRRETKMHQRCWYHRGYFIKFPPLSSTIVHFHPLSSILSTFVNYHPLLSTVIHFCPLSSTFINFTHFRPLSPTFIHFHILSSSFIYFLPVKLKVRAQNFVIKIGKHEIEECWWTPGGGNTSVPWSKFTARAVFEFSRGFGPS